MPKFSDRVEGWLKISFAVVGIAGSVLFGAARIGAQYQLLVDGNEKRDKDNVQIQEKLQIMDQKMDHDSRLLQWLLQKNGYHGRLPGDDYPNSYERDPAYMPESAKPKPQSYWKLPTFSAAEAAPQDAQLPNMR